MFQVFKCGRIAGISKVLGSLVLSLVLFASQAVFAAPCSQSNMVINKTATATASIGGNITYNITVTNNGPIDASNVAITDTLPPGTTFASSSAQLISGTAPSGVLTSTPPVGGTGTASVTATTWPVGTVALLTIVVNVNQNGVITNTAAVTADCDPDLSNNSSSASTTVTTSIPTMNEWGMIVFAISTGILSLYYLNRRRTA